MTYGNSPTDPAQGGSNPYGSGPVHPGGPQNGGQPGGPPPQYGSQPQYGAPSQDSPYGAPQQNSPYGDAQGGTPYGAPAQGSPYGAPQQGGAPQDNPYGGSPYGSGPYGAGAAPGSYGAAPMGAGSITTVVPDGPQQLGADGEPALSQPLYGATFMQATKRLFKKYIRFSGYASLSEHWWAYLTVTIVTAIASIPFLIGYVMLIASVATMDPYSTSVPTGTGAGGAIMMIGGILLFLVTLALIIPTLALQARRLHDAGFSALFLLLYLVPSIGSLIVLVFMFLPTKVEARRPEWDDTKGD